MCILFRSVVGNSGLHSSSIWLSKSPFFPQIWYSQYKREMHVIFRNRNTPNIFGGKLYIETKKRKRNPIHLKYCINLDNKFGRFLCLYTKARNLCSALYQPWCIITWYMQRWKAYVYTLKNKIEPYNPGISTKIINTSKRMKKGKILQGQNIAISSQLHQVSYIISHQIYNNSFLQKIFFCVIQFAGIMIWHTKQYNTC